MKAKEKHKTVKAEETRELLLDTALNLFQKNGFEKTTMRQIASRSGLATGAAYYYFRTKEEFVAAYYAQTLEEDRASIYQLSRGKVKLEEALESFLAAKLSRLAPYRDFLHVIGRAAATPGNPMSPFGYESSMLRKDSIELFRSLVASSTAKPATKIAAYLPGLLWLFQMGIIFFWLHDDSKGTRHTRTVISSGATLIGQFIKLTSLPILRSFNSGFEKLMDAVSRVYKLEVSS